MDNFLLKSSLVVMLRQLFSDHSLENRARFVFSTDAVRTHQHIFNTLASYKMWLPATSSTA